MLSDSKYFSFYFKVILFDWTLLFFLDIKNSIIFSVNCFTEFWVLDLL